MVESSPPSPFIVCEPDLLLELLVVAFDPPAQLGEVDHLFETDVLGKSREPVFGRLIFAVGPLDQQPLFRPALGEFVIAMGDANTHASKARDQRLGLAFPPLDRAPCTLRQTNSELFDRDRLMLVIATQELWWLPTTRSFLWW